MHSRSKCDKEKISTLTPNCIPKENREKNNSRLKEGGRGVSGAGGGQGPQKLTSKQEFFTFSFLSFLLFFFPLSLRNLLFKQQQQAVGTFHHCLQEERK